MAEDGFQQWLEDISQKTGIRYDPNDPLYDYHGAYKAGIEPTWQTEHQEYRWSDRFKSPDYDQFIEHETGKRKTKMAYDPLGLDQITETQTRGYDPLGLGPEEPSYLSKLGEAAKVGLKGAISSGLKPYENVIKLTGIPEGLEKAGIMGPGLELSEWTKPSEEEEEAGSKAGIPGEIVKGIAGAPATIASYAPWIALGGPVAGFMAPEALQIAENIREGKASPTGEEALRLAESAALGLGFKYLPPGLSKRVPLMAGMFGGQAFLDALAHGAPIIEAIKQAIAPTVVGGGLGFLGRKPEEKPEEKPPPGFRPTSFEPRRPYREGPTPTTPMEPLRPTERPIPKPWGLSEAESEEYWRRNLTPPGAGEETWGMVPPPPLALPPGQGFLMTEPPPRTILRPPPPVKGIEVRFTPEGEPIYPPKIEPKAPGFAPRPEITPTPTVTPPEGIKPQKPPVGQATDIQMARVRKESAEIGGLSLEWIKRWTGLGNKKASGIIEQLVESGEVEAALPGDPLPWRLKGVEPTVEIAALPPKLPGDILRYAPIIRELREMVNRGKPGSYPDFMKDQRWTKIQALQAIDKGLKGEELGSRQQKIWDTVKKEAKGRLKEQKIPPKEVKIPEVEGVKYDGVQKGLPGEELYQFTDQKTGGTFYLTDISKENIISNRDRIRTEFAKNEVEPTLEGTPLGEAARKAEFEKVQENLPFGIGDKVTGITEQGEFNGQVAEINLDGTVMVGAPDGRMVQLPIDKVKLPGRLPAVMVDGELLIGSGTHGSIPPERYSEGKDIRIGWLDPPYEKANFTENKPSRVEVDPLRTFIESKGIDFDKLTDRQRERWKGEFEKVEKETAEFATEKPPVNPLETETFQRISDSYSKENSPTKRIVENPEEIPGRILNQLPEEQRANVQGVYDPVEGVTYLVRKNIGSEANLKEIIDHEDIKHFALNTYLGKEADKWFERVYLKYGRSGLKDIAEERGFDLGTKEGRIAAAKEKVARTSIDEPGVIKQFWAWIREQVAKIFPNMKISDAEIQRNIKLATEAMERGELVGAERAESVEFATKLPPEEQRIQDKILTKVRDTRPLGTKIRDSWDSFYTNYVSEWWPLEKKDPVSGARIRLANAKGYGIAQTALEKGVPDINQNIGQPLNFIGEGFRQVLTPVVEAKELQNFIRYGVSKRAIEKYHQGVETGFDYNDAVFTVNKYEAKMIGDQTYRQIFDKLGIYQDNILKYYRDSGMLSTETYNNIKAKNLMYFPFYRALEEMGPEGVGKGSQAIRTLKRMKGGEQPLLDPIDSIVKNTYNLIMNAEKNMALREFANRSPNLAVEIKPGMPEYSMHRHSVSLYEMRKNSFFQSILEEAGIGKFDAQGNFRLNRGMKPELEEEIVGIFRPNFIKGKEDVFIVYENGKPRIFKTEPDIGRALHGFDRESVSSIMKILSYPTKLLRAGAILSPEFMIRNPFRDMFSAMVYSKYGFYPWDFFKGIVEFGRKGPDYYRWLSNGGSLSSFVSLDRTDLRSTAQQVLNRKKLQGVISGDNYRNIMSNMIKSPVEALRAITELSEMGTRLGIYMRALKKGAPEAEAIMQSRESTLDFLRIGAKGRAINMLVAFWNANVQGLDKLRRELNFINPETRPRAIRNFAKATMTLTVPSLLLAWANQDDPRYQELPEWQKALFWIIPTENHLWRIPKPFELGMIFGTVPEYIMRWLRTSDPDTFKNIGNALTAASMPGVVPTAVLPFVENWANKSFFTGRPIVPRGKEALKPEYQYQPYTTETAKWIGRQLSALPIIGDQIASPAKIENFVRGWSGGLGGHALRILDEGLVSSGIAPEEVKPSRALSDVPIIKAFVARYPGTDTSSLQKFYESYNEVTSLRSSINSLRKQGKAGEANLLLNANRQKINYYHAANSTHHAISNLKSSIDKIYSNPNIGSQEKRRLIEQIYLRMIAISRNFNERIGKNPWGGLQSSLPYLNLSGALSVWENATPEERERIAPEVLKKMREGKGD